MNAPRPSVARQPDGMAGHADALNLSRPLDDVHGRHIGVLAESSDGSTLSVCLVDMTINWAYIMAMKTANIAEFKSSLSRFIADVERGEEIEIRRRNLPIARVVPIPSSQRNATKLGAGLGTARIRVDLTEPLIPESDWQMLDSDER